MKKKGDKLNKVVEKEEEILGWFEDEGVFQWEGEDVLYWRVKLPSFSEVKRGRKWVQRYYDRVLAMWKKRWEEIYKLACEDLQEKRGRSRIFTPWRVSIFGEGGFVRESVVSIQLTSSEKRGKGTTFVSFYADLWDVNLAEPLRVSKEKSLVGKKKGEILNDVIKTMGNQKEMMVLPDFEERIRVNFGKNSLFLGESGVWVYFPQGTVTAREEGISKIQIYS